MQKVTPLELNTILSALEIKGIRGVIAGGAIRDYVMGFPAKDIDVFVPDNVLMKDLDAAFKVPGTVVYGDGALPVGDDALYERTPSLEIGGVFQYHYRGRAVQAIQLQHMPDKIEDLLHRMDFGICQAGWDRYTARLTPEFIRDAHARRFTLCRCGSAGEYRRSMRRFARLTAEGGSYSGWTLDKRHYAGYERELPTE